jgi:hypothetical protein
MGLTNHYELRPKPYLARFLDSSDMENLLKKLDGEKALVLRAAVSFVEEEVTEFTENRSITMALKGANKR